MEALARETISSGALVASVSYNLQLDKTIEKQFVDLQISPLHSYINNSGQFPLMSVTVVFWPVKKNIGEAGMAQWLEYSTRLPPMWLGFVSRTRRHMWVEFSVEFATENLNIHHTCIAGTKEQ